MSQVAIEEIRYNPLHHQVKEDLRQKIMDGVFPPRSLLPTERKLTDLYRISRGTVRQALRELEREGLTTSHQGRGTIVLGPGGRRTVLPCIKTMNIGFLFGWERDVIMSAPYYSAIYGAAEREALTHNYRVLFASAAVIRHKPPVAWFRQNFDGLLISEVVDRDLIQVVAGQGIPFVLVNCSMGEGAACNSVVVDNKASARRAVEYLIGLGHRRIGFVSERVNGYEHPVFQERLEGYRLALAGWNIPYDESLVVRESISRKGIFRDESPELLKVFRRARPQPTALFACNDIIAMESITALRMLDLSVPRDVSVVGFDDIEPAGRFEPPLTTMRVDTERLGRVVVRRLLSLIGAKQPSVPKEIVVSAELIERGTAGIIPRGGNHDAKEVER